MRLDIKKLEIEENLSNEVMSPKVFRPHRMRDKVTGKPLFHRDGIFSDRIFGRFGSCNCGAVTSPGYCEECDCRVVRRNKLPDFYLRPGTRVPVAFVNYRGIDRKEEAEMLLNFEAFVYQGSVIKLDLLKLDLTKFDEDKMRFGIEGLYEIGVDEEWFYQNTTDKIFIPHPYFRKIVKSGKSEILGPLNEAYIRILTERERLVKRLQQHIHLTKVGQAIYAQTIIKYTKTIYEEIQKMLLKGKKSIVHTELRGQKLSGAIRAVLVNDFSLDEDKLVIGKYFIKTLYPFLYDKYFMNGDVNIRALNKELEEEEYLILANRPPTIGELSFLSFKPEFNLNDNEQYVIKMNPISFSGYAADTDGDALLCISLYSREANEEAKNMLPSKKYLTGAAGEIRNKIPEDFIYTMKKLYEDNDPLAEELHKMIQK